MKIRYALRYNSAYHGEVIALMYSHIHHELVTKVDNVWRYVRYDEIFRAYTIQIVEKELITNLNRIEKFLNHHETDTYSGQRLYRKRLSFMPKPPFLRLIDIELYP